MDEGTVDLGLLELVGLGDGHGATVFEQFLAVYALHLLAQPLLALTHSLSHYGSQRTASHIPVFRHTYLRRVYFQGRSHRREHLRANFGSGQEQKVDLVLQRVDAVDDEVIVAKMEVGSMLAVEDGLDGSDVGFGIDVKEPFAQHLYFRTPYGLGGGHELAINVGDTYIVGIYDGKMPDTSAYEALSTPRPHPTDTKDDDAGGGKCLHDICAKKAFCTVVNVQIES